MAQISLDSIKRIEKYRNTIHDKVYTTYTTFEADGEKYVQIDTYGRIGRENPEKIRACLKKGGDCAKATK
ncbi:methionyl-tRNA formyltransferase [Intestinimonas timonensis]|uniref:methionyl-tRNA formyltransferase n=1 Tax=Intestinimonas timonensis TaxID=1689270 RepID=UPI00103137AD|nr:methionyl-tRNA formyltransferase [Intestinimonas timonensis]